MNQQQRRRYVAVAAAVLLLGGGAIFALVYRAVMMKSTAPNPTVTDDPLTPGPTPNPTRPPSETLFGSDDNPTTLPLAQNKTGPPTSGPTSSSNSTQKDGYWYPDYVNGESVCIYGSAGANEAHYASQGWLLDSELACCELLQLGNCLEKYIEFEDFWFPALTKNGTKYCDYGNHYPSSYVGKVLYDNEIECCKDYEISHCIPREPAHFPVEIDGVKACAYDVPPEEYPPTMIFLTRDDCCLVYPDACPTIALAYFPIEIDGVKTCAYDFPPEHHADTMIYATREECCEDFPEACPTSTLPTTTTPRPPVVAPPCETAPNGNECVWWPEVAQVGDRVIMICQYSSDWPDVAKDHLYPDNDGTGHETCCLTYPCTKNDDGSYVDIDEARANAATDPPTPSTRRMLR